MCVCFCNAGWRYKTFCSVEKCYELLTIVMISWVIVNIHNLNVSIYSYINRTLNIMTAYMAIYKDFIVSYTFFERVEIKPMVWFQPDYI